MAVRQSRSSEQRASLKAARSSVERRSPCLAHGETGRTVVLATREASRRRLLAQTFGGDSDGDVRGAEPIARARPLAPQRRLSLSARHPERRRRRRLRDPEGA